MYEAMSFFVPKVLMKQHKDPKWFDSDIQHHLKCLQTFKKRKGNLALLYSGRVISNIMYNLGYSKLKQNSEMT